MNKTETVIVITASGEISSKALELDENDLLLRGLQKIVGGYIETVLTVDFPPVFIMVVNEEGLIKQLPFNRAASALTGFGIFGDVALMQTGLRDGEPDLLGIPNAQIGAALNAIRGYIAEKGVDLHEAQKDSCSV